ncbi:MAG: phosphatidylserine decarboxylase [Actinomycetota bacterium]|jgi:phosphatidylserine decarboxylase
MAMTLEDWVTSAVIPFRDRPLPWLSQYHFFRDPSRPAYNDASYFFSPADGILLYQETVGPGEAILDVKGTCYSARDVLRDGTFDQDSLVIAVFMTFFDVHVNRIPYPGRLSYRLAEPVDTLNYPMLAVEEALLSDLRISLRSAFYLHNNQRVINRIDSDQLPGFYYVVQIADYDVDSITPFELRQHQPCSQGERFSQIRYGSQVELLIPLSTRYELGPLQPVGAHVEAGVDPLVEVRRRTSATLKAR